MLSLQGYLADPCGTASIPYWKQKALVIPEHMRVIHDRVYDPAAYAHFDDEPYFRLIHALASVGPHTAESVNIIPAASEIDSFVHLINASYCDLSVTAEQLAQYTKTPVYHPELWVLMKEKSTGTVLS